MITCSGPGNCEPAAENLDRGEMRNAECQARPRIRCLVLCGFWPRKGLFRTASESLVWAGPSCNLSSAKNRGVGGGARGVAQECSWLVVSRCESFG